MASDMHFDIFMMLYLVAVTCTPRCCDSLNVFMLFTKTYARHKVNLLEDGLGISRVMLMQQQQVQKP